MKTLRALIVEDEAPARANLREYLADAAWVEVAGEAADGREALAKAAALRPDLVFLDVQLPEMSGLAVARRLAAQQDVEIVFTTAFERFAIAAFEIGALDYLVKPFGRERFAAMLERLRARLGGDQPVSPGERAAAALADGPLTRLYARKGDRIVPIPVAAIIQVRAQGDYVEVMTDAGAYLLHLGLGELAERLEPTKFLRAHRSHLVNLDAVSHLQAVDDRRLRITLRDGAEVIASRQVSEALRKLVR